MTEYDNAAGHNNAAAPGHNSAGAQSNPPPPPRTPDVTTPDRTTRSSSPSANRLVAGILGIIFLILGALSFTALGSNPQFFGDNESLLFGAFQVSGLLIAIRIALGLALLLATRDTILGSARTNIWVGVISLLVAASAPFIDSAAGTEIFALTQADYVVFAVGSIVLIAAGVFLDRDHTRDATRTTVR